MVYKGKDHTNYWTFNRQKQTMENVLYNYLAHSFSNKGSNQVIYNLLHVPNHTDSLTNTNIGIIEVTQTNEL